MMNPDASLNWNSISQVAATTCSSAARDSNMLSTNWVIICCSLASRSQIPLMQPCWEARFTVWFRTLPMIRKRQGASGHPCCTPYWIGNTTVVFPFTEILAKACWKKRRTMVMKELGKPSRCRAKNRKDKSTVSQAFEKSSLKKSSGCLDCFANVIVSCVKKILSSIYCMRKKADQSGEISSMSTGWRRFSRASARKLQDIFSNMMGRQLFKVLRPTPLWRSTINPSVTPQGKESRSMES